MNVSSEVSRLSSTVESRTSKDSTEPARRRPHESQGCQCACPVPCCGGRPSAHCQRCCLPHRRESPSRRRQSATRSRPSALRYNYRDTNPGTIRKRCHACRTAPTRSAEGFRLVWLQAASDPCRRKDGCRPSLPGRDGANPQTQMPSSFPLGRHTPIPPPSANDIGCLLYTSDAA